MRGVEQAHAPPSWTEDDWQPSHDGSATLPLGDDRADREAQGLPRISATPFAWRDPRSIALRPWVYGRWLLRNTITAVVAPGGIGKSSLMASIVLALATGRSLLGKTVWEGPKSCWYWNLEDDGEELSRQIHAAAIHHEVTPDECADRLYIDSGLDGATLCTAVEERDGFRILRPVIEALVAELTTRKIDVLIVDPFVSSHAISENDNGAIDAVAKEWARVAKRASCSIVLVHHTRKLAGQKVTAEASRGAIALIAAARSTLVLNRMDTEEARHFGISEDDERRRLFSVQDDKANRAPAEKAEWYRLASVDLGNGGMDGAIPGDNIGVVTCWSPPDPLAEVPVDALYRVQCEVSRRSDAERYRADVQSPAWVGTLVADVMELSAAAKDKADRARINQLLRIWTDNGALVKVEGKDAKANPRTFVEVGHWVDAVSSPSQSEVRKGGDRWGNDLPHLTSPIKRRGGEDGEDQGEGEVGKPAFVKGNPALGVDLSKTRF